MIERFVPGAGGVENVAWQVAHELARQGEDVTVLAREIDPRATVAAERIPASRSWQPIRIAAFSHRVAARLARRDFDVVHGFSHTRSQDLFRAGGGSHRDWLRRTHAGPGYAARLLSPRYRVRFAVERDVFERSQQRIQCSSRLVADVLEREHGVAPDRIFLLPNGVEADQFDPGRAQAPASGLRADLSPMASHVWLLPGSGWHRKGLDTALRALARSDGSDVLWVAGRDRPARWRERARALGVADRVRFLGARDDMPVVYAAADAIVLPTRYDPFANVTIEAAAAARPVVTTRANGASEWLGDAILALDEADDDQALAASLALLRSADERTRRGDALAARARALDWSSHAKALRDEYEAIVARRAHTGARAPVRWVAGAEEARAKVDAVYDACGDVLHAGSQRRVVAHAPFDSSSSARIVTKAYDPPASRLRGLRDRVFDRRPAWREWRALRTLHAAGLPVPAPIALGVDTAGTAVVAMSDVRGAPLHETLRNAGATECGVIVERLAGCIARFHAAGFVHGDLHVGNVTCASDGPHLLDLQDARRTTSRRARRHDLARLRFGLDFDLHDLGGPALGAALRDALPSDPGLDAARRRFLRDHARGRSRKHLRIGGSWVALVSGDANRQGLGTREIGTGTLLRALRDEEPVRTLAPRRDGRVSIQVVEIGDWRTVRKHVVAGGLRREIADRLRGTSAARAFRRGQRDRLVSHRAARPLAYLERRATGRRLESTLLLEHVGDTDLDTWRPGSPDEARAVAIALATWLAEQHAVGLGHRDAKAGNLRMTVGDDAPRFWWVDLEDLTGPRRLGERKRVHALVQLNASLDDEAFDREARRAALDAYHARLPFRRSIDEIARRIHERSLARGHRYRGKAISFPKP